MSVKKVRYGYELSATWSLPPPLAVPPLWIPSAITFPSERIWYTAPPAPQIRCHPSVQRTPAIRVLIASRDHISNERTAAINSLTALLRVVDLGLDARGALTAGQITAIATWRTRHEELAIGVARAGTVRLAKRIRAADEGLSALTRQMTALLTASPAAGLLDQPGVGPVTAAIAFAAWSHPGRVRSEAAFASLAGVNPIPASSGNTVRHRINRGGDRRLNRALHMAVVTRMRMDPPLAVGRRSMRSPVRVTRRTGLFAAGHDPCCVFWSVPWCHVVTRVCPPATEAGDR